MKKWKLLLWAVGICLIILITTPRMIGTIFVVLADPNCTQTSFDPNLSPFPIDANRVVGILLPPIETVAGKLNRIGGFCDKEGDLVSVELVYSSADDVAVDANNVSGQWILTADLIPGTHYIIVQPFDHPAVPAEEAPAEEYTLVIHVLDRPNTSPRLY